MSSKETKQKLRDAKEVSMDELVKRGEMDEYAHLNDAKTSKSNFREWLKLRTKHGK